MSTGAVIAGRGTFEPVEGWRGDHHDGTPIYILSRHAAPAWAVGLPGCRSLSALGGFERLQRH
jgi:dihydrofolate reductase